MRLILRVSLTLEPFNTAARNGTAGATLNRIIEDAKREAVYFTEIDGARTAILVINLEHESQIPQYAEPWFLSFNAECQISNRDVSGRSRAGRARRPWYEVGLGCLTTTGLPSRSWPSRGSSSSRVQA